MVPSLGAGNATTRFRQGSWSRSRCLAACGALAASWAAGAARWIAAEPARRRPDLPVGLYCVY
jgi:hypothetical protein